MKTCGHCGETKEDTEFHIKTASPDGLQSWCKVCVSAYWDARHEGLIARREAKPPKPESKFKVCSKCKETKPIEEFCTNGINVSGTVRRRGTCRECDKSRYVEMRKKKKEKEVNAKRFRNVFHDLNEVSKKVFSAVPCEDAWPIQDIYSQLYRSGTRTDNRTLTYLLRMLKESKLVSEPIPTFFKRASIDPEVVKEALDAWRNGEEDAEEGTKPETPEQVEAEVEAVQVIDQQENKNMKETNAKTNAKTPSNGPIEILSELALRMTEIMKSVQDVVDSLDAAAIQLDEQNKAREADTAKLRQLQALLKSLGE